MVYSSGNELLSNTVVKMQNYHVPTWENVLSEVYSAVIIEATANKSYIALARQYEVIEQLWKRKKFS